jgi:hypothetical protein
MGSKGPVEVKVVGPVELGAAGIAHRAMTIANEDLFQMLGLPFGAPADAARAAYFRLAKLWHPERLPSDLAVFRSEVETVFAQMTRAHASLTDPETYRAYVMAGPKGDGTASIKGKPREDVIREIEVALARRDFGSAETCARLLVALDPEDGEAQALAIWALIQGGEAAEDALRASLPQFDKVIQTNARCDRAYFLRGSVQKRLGNTAAAFRDFTRVMHLTPKNVEAEREVRIIEMRARKGSGEHSLEGLLSKMKKK